jgi:hypothetical protein
MRRKPPIFPGFGCLLSLTLLNGDFENGFGSGHRFEKVSTHVESAIGSIHSCIRSIFSSTLRNHFLDIFRLDPTFLDLLIRPIPSISSVIFRNPISTFYQLL